MGPVRSKGGIVIETLFIHVITRRKVDIDGNEEVDNITERI